MRNITGGCLCGRVRYRAEADPLFTTICHCRNCQKQAGSAFSVVVAVPRTTLTLSGDPKVYHDKSEGGQEVARTFCPDCGSPIISEAATMPGLAIIKAGTLDDTSWLEPTMEVFCDSAQPWLKLSGKYQQFPRMPV